MAEPVGLGLIGCGQIAPHHIRNSRDDPAVRWAAACDLRREAVDAVADEFDIPARYTDVADLLADRNVDAVVVATSPTTHVDPTVQAFRAGKHVLVEKPVAVNAGEVEAMLAAQTEGLVGACCSSRFRSTDAARVTAERIASGELGPVRRLCARVVQPAPEDYDGTSPFFLLRPGWGNQGVLADWGCYDLDYLFGLCSWSLAPEQVTAEMRRVPDVLRQVQAPANDVEVHVGALAMLSGGAVLDFRRSLFAAADQTQGQWRIECEHGALDLNMLPGSPQVVERRLTRTGVASHVLVDGPYTWSEIHSGPVVDFARAVRDGREPMTSLANALTMQRLADAMYESARTGRAVAIA